MNSVCGAHPSYAEGVVIGDKYRLERLIGEGGMAKVWRATDLTLRRPVALKFIQVLGDDADETRKQFLREARAAAAVRHRNVVDIIDFGTAEDGRAYMVMEHLEGESLADRMTDGMPLDVADTVRILADALSGLAAVHDAGIVHRDVKPENIFLVRDADGEYAKVLDFGVSRSVGKDRQVQSVVRTMDDVIAGTPEYMAPEHARGGTDVDHRADIYSMGVVLYEALTGRVPFDGDASGEIMINVLTAEPIPPLKLRPSLRREVAEVIERAMHRDRDVRFANAREMRGALVEALGQPGLIPQPFSQAPPAIVEETQSNIRRITPLRGTWWRQASPWKRAGMVGGPLVTLLLVGWAIRPSSDSPHMEIETGPPESLSLTQPVHAAIERPYVAPHFVVVQLRGVPRGAVVSVDGIPHEGTRIELEQSERVHDIRVASGGKTWWEVLHKALRGAEYRIEALPPPSAATPRTLKLGRSTAAPVTRVRGTGSTEVPAEGAIFTDPGF